MSQGDARDQLSIKIIAPEVFDSAEENGSPFDPKNTDSKLTRSIPRQLPKGVSEEKVTAQAQ